MKTSRMDWKVGAASCLFGEQAVALEDMTRLSENGVNFMELDMQNRWQRWPACDLKAAWKHLGDHAKRIGLTIWSLHIPYGLSLIHI